MTFDLSKRDKCFVIAEAGTAHADPDHLKRLPKAMRYVRAAAEAGASACKFQIFDSGLDDMFCWIDGDEARAPRWKSSYMPLHAWRQVKEFAEANGIMFLASVFQNTTVRWLTEMDVAAVKVASRAAKNFPYGDIEGPYLISTGMEYPAPATRPDATYLQCQAKYPSDEWWGGRPAINDGFSDHSGHPFRAINAITRGCMLVEVHFMIDPLDAGPDLPACLNLDELALVCRARDYFDYTM